jgi:hypothetical protein
MGKAMRWVNKGSRMMCQLTCSKIWTPNLIEIDKIPHIQTCTQIVHISKYTPMQNVRIQVHTHKNINHNKTWGQTDIFLVFHGPLYGLESQKQKMTLYNIP